MAHGVEAIQRLSATCRMWPWTLTYQKIPLCVSSQGQHLYSYQKLNMYIYWFSSESGYRRLDDDDADANNAGRHSTTTRGTYRQLPEMQCKKRHNVLQTVVKQW